jgi:hypothetical protein
MRAHVIKYGRRNITLSKLKPLKTIAQLSCFKVWLDGVAEP